MTPEMALAHHLVDLHKKAADIRNTQASTALTAAKVSQIPHQNLNTAHQTVQTAVNTNRLLQTPIPQPAAPGAP
jgi:guanyl-specific ribonuclease Sa